VRSNPVRVVAFRKKTRLKNLLEKNTFLPSTATKCMYIQTSTHQRYVHICDAMNNFSAMYKLLLWDCAQVEPMNLFWAKWSRHWEKNTTFTTLVFKSLFRFLKGFVFGTESGKFYLSITVLILPILAREEGRVVSFLQIQNFAPKIRNCFRAKINSAQPFWKKNFYRPFEFDDNQSDQIGRVFALRAIVFFGQFFWKLQKE
jgi:hypothetical protein